MNLRKIINLSPLVDVLMIVIFWYIMMSNQTLEENKAAAQNELESVQNRYEQVLDEMTQERNSAQEEAERLEKENALLAEEKTALSEEMERYRETNDDLSDQLQDLRETNHTLEEMLEQAVGYVYIRLYDGLNKNRMVEVTYESELVDKFLFSNGEDEYLEQKLKKVITEYATREEKERIAILFIYEGSNAFYLDITRIMNVLYELRAEFGASVHTINMAE
ncbi:MAG: hypothetical protein E7260_10410 [Lachnospiraceae bacterium]|nr:hypothetical protein [Lachnospiraceae bacterium]